jgi:hypothetical protein
MRRFAFRVDQMPAWAFVVAAAAVFGAARAGRLFALLHHNRGGMELGAIVTLVTFLIVVIFAVRRRHERAWQSTVHVMGSLVAGNALGILLIWPFIPSGYDLALFPMLRDTMSAGAAMAALSLPLCVGLLWLSRRYGSHSALTERRQRLVRENQLRKLGISTDQTATGA